MEGFLLVDKPKGITSFYCLKQLRKIFNMKRIGFVGTLDPLATGLLIFALGELTKLITFLEKKDKKYEAVIRLGAESDTYDADGKIRKLEDPRKPEEKEIKKFLKEEFTGEIMQAPPAYSAIQIEGKRAHELARKNKKVILKKRSVKIYKIDILSYKWPTLKLRIVCGSGTYIRSLANDLGKALRCGGYVKDLRRLSVGDFNVKNAKKNDELSKKDIISPEKMFPNAYHVELTEDEYKLLSNGAFIDHKDVVPAREGSLILSFYKSVCVGVLEVRNGKFKFAKKFNL
jgi:tRNA pseudouridine55 synthase